MARQAEVERRVARQAEVERLDQVGHRGTHSKAPHGAEVGQRNQLEGPVARAALA